MIVLPVLVFLLNKRLGRQLCVLQKEGNLSAEKRKRVSKL
jgi:hypothetical protein